jgi:hypothetical protein
MVTPTNSEPRRFVPRAGRDVWKFAGPLGYLESIQAAGSVTAPLLADASFTLVALILQSTTPFGRWQDLALLLLVPAGLAQVFAVQSVIWTRRYMATPDELKQWFPDDFTDHGERPTPWLLNVQGHNDRKARKMGRPDAEVDKRRHLAAARRDRRRSGADRAHQPVALDGYHGGMGRLGCRGVVGRRHDGG